MTGVITKTTVTLSLSALDWELYTTEHPAACARAAAELNRAVAAAINSSSTQSEAYDKCKKVFDKHASLGARDSEPMYHLDKILDKAFPPKRPW